MRSKKNRGGKAAAPDLIQIMTISLFVILLAFFILLNSIAVIDNQKKLAVLDSLIGTFGVMTGGKSIVEGKGGTITLPDMEHQSSHVDFSDLMVGAEDIVRVIRITTDHRGTVMILPAHLLFEPFAPGLLAGGRNLLDRIALAIRKNDLPVQIVAHTDDGPPPEGVRMSNRELSTLWATDILGYFVGEKGLNPVRFTAYGWGASRPVVTNKTRETRQMNRRIELVFVHEAPPGKPRGIFTFKNFFFNVFD